MNGGTELRLGTGGEVSETWVRRRPTEDGYGPYREEGQDREPPEGKDRFERICRRTKREIGTQKRSVGHVLRLRGVCVKEEGTKKRGRG